MYSLVESCKMNKIDFGDYIEYILREIMDGNKDYRSLLPTHFRILSRRGIPLIVNPTFQSVGRSGDKSHNKKSSKTSPLHTKIAFSRFITDWNSDTCKISGLPPLWAYQNRVAKTPKTKD